MSASEPRFWKPLHDPLIIAEQAPSEPHHDNSPTGNWNDK